MEEYLKVCFDRLVRLGVGSIPTTLDLATIVEWADSTAILEINAATKFIADQKEDMISLEKRRRNQLFQDPKQRGAPMVSLKVVVQTMPSTRNPETESIIRKRSRTSI